MKKFFYLCIAMLVFTCCNRPTWHKTADGIYIYCISHDKYPSKWTGNVVGCFADGNGELITYNNNGDVKSRQSLSTILGVSKEWNYLPYKNYKYLGELDDNLPNGFGVKLHSDTISIGEFKDSYLYTGYCEKYICAENEVLPVFKGSYKKGKINGIAKFYENGILAFEGNMHKGLRKGMGKEYHDGMLVYEGNYEKDLKHGYGKAFKDGLIWYDGTWKKGKRSGQGKLYNENGIIVYDGKWDDDLYDGKGKLYENGMCIEGKWDEGKLVKSISTSPFDEIVHATKIWLNIDSTNVDAIKEENISHLPESQMEFVTQLQNDLDAKLREELSKRIEKRFGFWHLLRMWIQPWATSDVKRARNAQDFFCKNLEAKDMQQFINAKIDYYNRNVPSDEKLNYIKLHPIPDGTIVDTNVALKVFDREALETTDTLVGILIDILVCVVIATIIGFILGFIFWYAIEFIITLCGIIDTALAIIAFSIGIYISIFKTSALCMELENQILDMLVNNYIQYIDSQNIVAQMLGLL